MPSFEFKPQQQVTHWDASMKNVVWTEKREGLPQALQGLVSLATWQATYDAIFEQYQSRYNGVNYTTSLPFVNLVALPYNVGTKIAYESRWKRIIEAQAPIYEELGVKVTLLQSTERRNRRTTIGLKFETMPRSSTALAELAFQ